MKVATLLVCALAVTAVLAVQEQSEAEGGAEYEYEYYGFFDEVRPPSSPTPASGRHRA